jgi:hypothetical protein
VIQAFVTILILTFGYLIFFAEQDTPLTALLTGAVFGHAVNTFIWPWMRARHCANHLQLEVAERSGKWVHLRITNETSFALKNAVVYISIENGPDDVLPTIEGGAFVVPSTACTIIEDRVAFALERNKSHEYSLTIAPHERQSVLFVAYERDHIGFASEQGHLRIEATEDKADGSSQIKVLSAARCFLRVKDYCVLIKVVSDEALASYWAVKVKPTGVGQPKRIRNRQQYEDILAKFKDPEMRWNIVCPCTP